MKRRDAIKGGLGVLAYGAARTTFGAAPCPPTLGGTAPVTCPTPEPPSGGPIGSLVSTMSSNSWQRLTTTTGLGDITSGYLSGAYGRQQGNRGFFEFATNGIWIEDHAELHFRGSGHQSGGIHIRYKESTGAWEYLNSFPVWEHQYDHTAYDQSRNIMYATRPEERGVQKWSHTDGSGSWGSAASRIGNFIIAEGLEYFPEANGGAGGLVHYGSFAENGSQTGGIRLSNPTVTSWSWVDGNFFSSSGARYHLNATYLHAQRVVICGGGDSGPDAVAMSAAGNVTSRNRLPGHWGASDNNAMGTVLSDSRTGRIFFVCADRGALYEHNYPADQWNNIGSLPSRGPRSFATMVSTYGAIVYVTGASTDLNPTIWVYKL